MNTQSFEGISGRRLLRLCGNGEYSRTINKLSAEINKIARDENSIKALAAQGVIPKPGTREDYAELVRFETQRWTEVVKNANISIE